MTLRELYEQVKIEYERLDFETEKEFLAGALIEKEEVMEEVEGDVYQDESFLQSDRHNADAIDGIARASQVVCSLLFALGKAYESYQPWLKLSGWACFYLQKFDWAASYAILAGERELIAALPEVVPSNRNVDARIPWKLARPDHSGLELHSTYGGEWEEQWLWIFFSLSEGSLDGLGNSFVYLAKDQLETGNGFRYEQAMYPAFDLFLNASLVLARQSGFNPETEKWSKKVRKFFHLGNQKPL